MTKIFVCIKVMPEGPETDLELIKTESQKIIEAAGAKFGEAKENPIGFGLKEVIVKFMCDEEKGSADPIAEKMAKIAGVNTAEITEVGRLT